MVTLRVYDSGHAEVGDRYTLYCPVPRNRVSEVGGIRGIYLGFNFNKDGDVIRYMWDEDCRGVAFMNLGRKLRREYLPKRVADWVSHMEEVYNRAWEEDTVDAWDAWNKC